MGDLNSDVQEGSASKIRSSGSLLTQNAERCFGLGADRSGANVSYIGVSVTGRFTQASAHHSSLCRRMPHRLANPAKPFRAVRAAKKIGFMLEPKP